MQGLDVGRANAQYQECVDDIYSSDINQDFELTDDEYLLFIAKRSNGAIVAENFSDLPFSLITNFVYGACFCSIVFQVPNCCVGGGALIDLNPDDSPFIVDNLITICGSVDEALEKEIGTLPPVTTLPPVVTPTISPTLVPSLSTPSPTASVVSPTVVPTNLATDQPSGSPSASPTTLKPSVMPSLMPSVSPSLSPTDIPTITTPSKFNYFCATVLKKKKKYFSGGFIDNYFLFFSHTFQFQCQLPKL
jgi:hypothetical protein